MENHPDSRSRLTLSKLTGSCCSGLSSHTFCHALGLVNVSALTFVWLYLVSAGFTANGILDGVYEIQARALAAGHLHIEPGPMQMFFHDTLMYWGEYYFYWGLLPSGLFLVLAAVFGRIAAHYLTVILFLFCLAYFLQRVVCLIVASASGSSLLSQIGGMALVWVILFVIPYPADLDWFFGRFAVYEQQVLFGLGAAMPGVYFLIRALRERCPCAFATSALLFCLAAWTRVTWFPLAAAMVPTAAFVGWRWKNGRDGGSQRLGTVVMVASAALIVGLMVINYVRFGSLLDFGVRYQNPGHYLYFRNLKMFFSPETRIWNCLFNFLSYYVSPEMVEHLGLASRSFAYCEGYPPSFFSFNPQFLLLLVLLPLGLYRARRSDVSTHRAQPPIEPGEEVRSGSLLYIPFLVLTGVALYLHVLVSFFGTFVIFRYFVECYYFTALVFLTILLMLARPAWALPAFVLLLALSIPGTIKAFLTVRPELRTVNPKASFAITSPGGMTPFVEHRVLWPLGSLTGSDLPRLPPYAVMGVDPEAQGNLLGKDIFAVYLIPKGSSETMKTARLTVRGLRPLQSPGTALFFFEDRLIGSQHLDTAHTVDVSIDLPFSLERKAPYQVMVVFLPRGLSYLPARSSGQPVVLFREIALDEGGSRSPEKR